MKKEERENGSDINSISSIVIRQVFLFKKKNVSEDEIQNGKHLQNRFCSVQAVVRFGFGLVTPFVT